MAKSLSPLFGPQPPISPGQAPAGATLLIREFLSRREDVEVVILSPAKNLLFSGGSGTQADASLSMAVRLVAALGRAGLPVATPTRLTLPPSQPLFACKWKKDEISYTVRLEFFGMERRKRTIETER